jgi:hypothetical protein
LQQHRSIKVGGATLTARGDLTAHPDERCNVCNGHGVLAGGIVTMSKTMRLLAALPTAQKLLAFEMKIRPFEED